MNSYYEDNRQRKRKKYFLRCPYCQKQLPLYFMSGGYCPRCGENVNK